LAVGKAKDFVASFGQRLVARGISLPMVVKAVLMSINFNNHARTPAFKINNVGRKRRLPAEMMAQNAKLAKAQPELDFLTRHRLAQAARAVI